MPEPFKNFFNRPLIRAMGGHFQRVDASFPREAFVRAASRNLDELELKERSNQILSALEASLPGEFRTACRCMTAALHPDGDATLADSEIDERGLRGWAVMPMADYVARRGLEDFDFSMEILRTFTTRFSSEFAVRPFLLADSEKALRHARRWTKDPNEHVRRLASEGTRPRLPWGLRLPPFIANPSPILPILESLKDDPSEYVRRSVANNLNDIAKDHPDVVSDIAAKWMRNASAPRQRLIRHACRTLVKQGDTAALKALGYGPPKIRFQSLELKTKRVALGGHLEFAISLQSASSQKQSLVIDYIVHHLKANGETAPKVFKWKTVSLSPKQNMEIAKRHPIKRITTRAYYSGRHRLEIQINGASYGAAEFDLTIGQ